ncbi:hypothetical protein RUM44_003006 [Polyplax serrata]|uniref:Mannose-6-phosphate isomerase n=1 Tax=Polyplax serrata TaxID=468196 RepID=A0ABR1AXA6_POLSC
MDLICSVQKYQWGNLGFDSLVGRFAKANSKIVVNENEPYAELWMGTHPNGPSYISGTNTKLSDYLNSHPQDLGQKVLHHFGKQLPFLFKILSVKQPLSIQAHPTKSNAEKLFKRFPNIYKDGNHKPEMAIALSKFEALCGFRPKTQIKRFLDEISEFNLLIDSVSLNKFLASSDCEDSEISNVLMKECFQLLMSNKEDVVAAATGKLISRLRGMESSKKEYLHWNLIHRVHSVFPNDIGIFCIYWLNYLELAPGEALYLAPNEPHAYLKGDCIECMANSDNVIRAGLTPKFRDIETLCDMLTYKSYQPDEILFCPIKENEYCLLYSPPITDFAVAKIVLPENCHYTLQKRCSASILLIIEGTGTTSTTVLEFGKVLFVPESTEIKITSNGITMYQAFCNV